MPVKPLIGRLPEAFANPQTGMAKSLMEIKPEQLSNFYNQTSQHLKDIMSIEQQKHPSAQKFAIEKYSKVKKPFQIFAGFTRDSFDYITLCILLITILYIAAVTPTFSNEYQTGADSILRCTKHGRTRLAITKVLAAITIFTVSFVICISIHLLISNLAFGFECKNTSMQMLFSVISLPNLNLGELQIVLAVGGLLSLLAMISFTLFLSSKFKDSITVVLVSILSCIAPIFLYTAGVWIGFLFPSGGVGLQNNLLYQLAGFNFVHIGSISIWSPYIILGAAILETPLFLFMAIRTYNKHQVN